MWMSFGKKVTLSDYKNVKTCQQCMSLIEQNEFHFFISLFSGVVHNSRMMSLAPFSVFRPREAVGCKPGRHWGVIHLSSPLWKIPPYTKTVHLKPLQHHWCDDLKGVLNLYPMPTWTHFDHVALASTTGKLCTGEQDGNLHKRCTSFFGQTCQTLVVLLTHGLMPFCGGGNALTHYPGKIQRKGTERTDADVHFGQWASKTAMFCLHLPGREDGTRLNLLAANQ